MTVVSEAADLPCLIDLRKLIAHVVDVVRARVNTLVPIQFLRLFQSVQHVFVNFRRRRLVRRAEMRRYRIC